MKNLRKKQLSRYILSMLTVGLFGLIPVAYALPVQDTTHVNTAGTNIATATSQMNITGTAANNVMNWNTFSIAKGEKVQFDEKNYLNLVRGASKSEIDGALTGGGNIYLINPNGILFGSTAQVNVGNLVASTRAIDNVDADGFASTGANPLASVASSAAGDIVNLGKLQTASVILEGNNITIQNAADITSDGTNALTDSVTAKAAGIITVGHAVTATTTRSFIINKTATDKTVHDYANATVTASGYKATALDGTTENAVKESMLVENVYDLQNINAKLDGNYILSSDIDASGTADWNYSADDLYSTGFTPLSTFTGTFDGATHVINDLYIKTSTGSNVGLFSMVTNGTIQNVGMVNDNITGRTNVGAVVGMATGNSTITNVYNTGTVTGYNSDDLGKGEYVGGVIGRTMDNSTVTITNVYNTGKVSGTNYVGGVVGTSTGGTITNVYNTGTVNGNSNVGGVAGTSSAAMANVYNTGTVSGGNNAGGVVGTATGGSITNVYNTGTVSGGTNVGGVAGDIETRDNIEAVYNTGTVSGNSNVGGVAGLIDSCVITDAYNTGAVSGSGNNVGGVAGNVGGSTLQYAYNTGTVSGNSNGGVVGYLDNASMDHVYNIGAVEGTNDVGGVLGKSNRSSISNVLWATDLTYMPVEGHSKPTQAIGTISTDSDVDTNTVKGATLADMKKASTYTGWSGITSADWHYISRSAIVHWHIYEGYTTPLLSKLFKGTVNVIQRQTTTYNGKSQTAVQSAAAFDSTVDTSHIYACSATNAGTHDLFYSDQQGYNLLNDDQFIINPITLTGTINAPASTFTKEYDGTTSVSQPLGNNYTLDTKAVISGDIITGLDTTKASGVYDNKNVGNNKTITFSGLTLTGTSAGNYTIASTLSGNVGQITQKDLTVALLDAQNISKVYDGTTTVTAALVKDQNYSLPDLVSGDAVTLTASGTYDNKNAGTGKQVSFTNLGLTGTDAGNYNLKTKELGGTIGQIDQRTIAAEIKSGSTFAKEYDGTDVVTTALVKDTNYILTNVVSGDDLSLDTTKISGTYTPGKDVGDDLSVIFTGLKLTGKDAGNYDLLDFAMGENYGKITPKALTATLTGDNVFTKVYDGTTTVNQALGTNYALDGIVADSDKVSLSAGSGAYNDKNAGDNKTVTFSGLTLTGTGAGNYTIASTLSGVVGQITRKTITGSLASGYSFDKQYDGTTTATLGNGYTLNGVVPGDTVPLTAANGFYDSSVMGDRTVTFSGFSINDGNYLLSMADSLSGTGKIISGLQDQIFIDSLAGFGNFFDTDPAEGMTVNSEDYIVQAVAGNNGQSYKVGVAQVTQTWYNGPLTLTIVNGGINLPKGILLGNTYDQRSVIVSTSGAGQQQILK